MPTPRLRAAAAVVAASCLILVVAIAAGCNMAAWGAHGVGGGKTKIVTVPAQYHGLENQRVAVLIAADEYLLYEYPQAPLAVSRAMSAKIAGNVTGATVMSPQEILDYQTANPYWTAVPYSELIRKLDVDRVVLVDLIEYRTHEPGNAHVWQGMITGEVGVIEADSEDPDNFAFSATIRGQYPEQSTVGLLNSDDATVELGMLAVFTRDAAGLFFEYEKEVPK